MNHTDTNHFQWLGGYLPDQVALTSYTFWCECARSGNMWKSCGPIRLLFSETLITMNRLMILRITIFPFAPLFRMSEILLRFFPTWITAAHHCRWWNLLTLVGGLDHGFYFSHHIGHVIIPTDFNSIIVQRGRLKPPTRLLLTIIINHHH